MFTKMIGKFAPFVLTALACSDCSRPKIMDVGPDEFVLDYDSDRTRFSYCKYAGQRGGFHYLEFFDTGPRTTIATYKWTKRTPVAGLPPSFPDHAQKPILPYPGAKPANN